MIDRIALLRHLELSDKPWQLVKHIDDVPVNKIVYPMWGEIKYDGVFCAVVLGEFQHDAVSRTGKLFYTAVNELLYPYIPKHSSGHVVIGELINKHCSLEVLSGLVNPNRVNPWTDEERELMNGVDYIVHDVLTFGEVIAGFSPIMYRDRSDRLMRLSANVCIAEGKMLHSQAEFDMYAQEIIAAGGEGIVGKNLHAGYEAGHKGWRVVKKVRDLHVDLKCLDVQTGKGKRTGQIAKLQFMYKGKLFWADLGEGWTDEKRAQLTERWVDCVTCPEAPYCNTCLRDNPIGKVFHVKALQESSKGVLRLPKVMEMRIDKTEEDRT